MRLYGPIPATAVLMTTTCTINENLSISMAVLPGLIGHAEFPYATLVPAFFLCFDVDSMAALVAVLNVFCKQQQTCMHSFMFTSASLKADERHECMPVCMLPQPQHSLYCSEPCMSCIDHMLHDHIIICRILWNDVCTLLCSIGSATHRAGLG